jgi:hypothetical protein
MSVTSSTAEGEVVVSKLRALGSVASGLALVAVSGAVGAAPAAAASPLHITSAYCVAQVGPFNGGLECNAHAVGGAQPHTYTWTPNYYPQSQWPVPGPSVVLGCNPGWSFVTLVVRDAAGQTATAQAGDWCNTPGEDPL